MSRAPQPDDGPAAAEQLGIRVFCLTAPDPQQLADQVALTLGEHLHPNDELHITHSAVPNAWRHTPGRDGWHSHPAHTQIALEYTALLILRPPAAGTRADTQPPS